MASAEQIKALLRSHVDGDEAHFLSVAMQVAASEARKGHDNVARELRSIIDEAKMRRGGVWESSRPIPITQPRGELADLLEADYSDIRLSDMSLDASIESRLQRVVREHEHIHKLREHGLSARRKLLLVGPPGSGKTMTGRALAGELGLPLFTVRLDGLITKYMGETIAKLRLIFDAMAQTRGVYLFDEFDSIGSDRSLGNDVGEIRRVLNAFLIYIERDSSLSLLIAATNYPQHLDWALFRRFDDVIRYELPDSDLISKALRTRFALYSWVDSIDYRKVGQCAIGLNFSDVIRSADEAIKDLILENRSRITTQDILRHLKDRKNLKPRE